MHFERDIYHNQKLDGNNMGQMCYERNVYQNQCPNIGDYDTIYGSTQMCTCYTYWVGNMDDCKSTSCYVFLLGSGAIS
jgi:hypothetical protein